MPEEIKLITPMLGLDPFILVEFIETDDEMQMSIRSSHIPQDELAQALREIADFVEAELDE